MALFWVLALQCIIAVFAEDAEKNIVNGFPIPATEAPYMAVLKPMYCGGSIIGKKHILTAAQCLKHKPAPKTVEVGVGGDDRKHLHYVKVHSYVSHPLYNDTTHDYDVAVITLEKPLHFSDKVKPVQLEEPTENFDEFFTHTRVTGWGDTDPSHHSPSKHLMAADGVLFPWFLCKLNYYPYNRITDRMICSSDLFTGADRCTGDSGGPLIDKRTRKQIGIASFGHLCGEKLYPGVYTSMFNSGIYTFIRDHIHHKE